MVIAGTSTDAGGEHLAHDDFIDLARGQAATAERGRDDPGAELTCGQAGEGAPELADRSADGGDDDDIFHSNSPLWSW
jgi:hypothetical protein